MTVTMMAVVAAMLMEQVMMMEMVVTAVEIKMAMMVTERVVADGSL